MFERLICRIKGHKPFEDNISKIIWCLRCKQKLGHMRVSDLKGNFQREMPPRAPRNGYVQDIGKFMKHGKQAPWYRKSIKAKIKPEED